MRPSKKLLNTLFAFFCSAIFVFAFRLAINHEASGFIESLWWWALILFGFVVVYDLVRYKGFSQIEVLRELPHSLALGVSAPVTLQVKNPYSFPLSLSLTDLHPSSVITDSLPIHFKVDAGSSKKIVYPVVPIERGEGIFKQTCLRVTTLWGFWQKLESVGEIETLKIYPNFAPIAQFASVGLEHQIAQLGIHLQQRRGEGSDFHQLREFREGDSMRQIDWKATARYRKPISRDYQDERDQDIVFLLDCGRRLRSKDDQISHFDHALNALLLTAYVALRQGDAVGLMSFAGDQRWMSPAKGPAKINTLLNQLYDLHCTTETSDYLQAAEKLLGKYNKRALVVVITNVQQTDMDDLSSAVKLLSKKHVVLIASLRDGFLDARLNTDVSSFSDALSYCGVSEFMSDRHSLRKKLQSLGVIMTDSLPQHLHLDLVNEYLKVKRSGRL